MAKKSTSTRPADRSGTRESTSKRGPIRYAVVGLGYISQVAALPAFEHARNSKLAALVSDDPTKLKKLGAKYRVKSLCSYDEYNDLMRSGEVDAVYIGLPNTLHAEYAVRAANAGVHVLCEKPMATTATDCKWMIGAARDAGVKLMIAYRLHFERGNMSAVEIAKSGKLGDLRVFTSDFTNMVDDRDNIRLDAQLGGGTLWDIGIYCINAARYVFRSEPTEVVAWTAQGNDPRFAQVEEAASAILRFPGERLASFTCSFGAAGVSSYRVIGTRGDLRVEPAYEFADEIAHTLTIGSRKSQRTFPKRDQFAPELVYFSDCILHDREPEPSGEEGLYDVQIIQALYRAAKSGKPVKLDLPPRADRPGLATEIQRPPVAKPELVHATGPSTKGD